MVPALKNIVARHRKDPRQPIVIVAHAKSSEDSAIAWARAQLLRAQLTNQWPLLLAEFEPSVSDKRRLGLREAQLILQDLGAYKGQAAGMMDDETRAALKAYQKGAALPESGVLDTATRKSLLHGYFGREGTTATKDARIEACVCTGKTDFVKLPCGEAVEDDRVEVLFFEPRLEGEVPQSADGRWDKWMKQVRETEDVERYGLHLRITDHNGVVCPGACVKVIGPSTQETKADEHGWVSVVPLERGHYEVELWEEGERIGESELDIPAGARSGGQRAPPDPHLRGPLPRGPPSALFFRRHLPSGGGQPGRSQEEVRKARVGSQSRLPPGPFPPRQTAQAGGMLIDADSDAWLGFVKDVRDRDVQSFMAFFAKQGWPTDPGAIDGVAGRKTRRAVAQFQACCNEVWGLCLVVDGQCGPKTWKAVFHALQEMIKTSEIANIELENLEGDKS
ncbi:MAG: peptidoglycan-binding protein [Fibrobacteres bacterium]|nr:peptidoglycan-binding protein [Fibrobacterota bacterium]